MDVNKRTEVLYRISVLHGETLLKYLDHAVGGKKMYRNHYSVAVGTDAHQQLGTLVGLGLARVGVVGDENITFHATTAGNAFLKAYYDNAGKGSPNQP